MKHFQLKLSLISILFALISNSIYSQNKALELANALLISNLNSDCNCHNTINTNQPFFEGKVILKDSSVYKGNISINQPFENKMFTILKIDNTYNPLENDLIKEVHLTHTEEETPKETKYINLNSDERLYRLIYKNDDLVSAYDASNEPFDKSLIGRIFIKENKTLTDTWNFWSSGPKKDVINYINDRDDTNYKRRDFESLNDLFAKL
ncbi:hypothetical protein [Winogradskyella sp. SM1960]|uniref:hypothetical protein n=1 Tax=Winogradskyella sp. SM1960 TaxID=2865955 RepID=UPI001CD69016|nr:hypothetical protein [Winogradskyella sp. SM1960]